MSIIDRYAFDPDKFLCSGGGGMTGGPGDGGGIGGTGGAAGTVGGNDGGFGVAGNNPFAPGKPPSATTAMHYGLPVYGSNKKNRTGFQSLMDAMQVAGLFATGNVIEGMQRGAKLGDGTYGLDGINDPDNAAGSSLYGTDDGNEILGKLYNDWVLDGPYVGGGEDGVGARPYAATANSLQQRLHGTDETRVAALFREIAQTPGIRPDTALGIAMSAELGDPNKNDPNIRLQEFLKANPKLASFQQPNVFGGSVMKGKDQGAKDSYLTSLKATNSTQKAFADSLAKQKGAKDVTQYNLPQSYKAPMKASGFTKITQPVANAFRQQHRQDRNFNQEGGGK